MKIETYHDSYWDGLNHKPTNLTEEVDYCCSLHPTKFNIPSWEELGIDIADIADKTINWRKYQNYESNSKV